MTKLGDLYTDFFRIDLDAPGGYARVADVLARQKDGSFVHRAFKLLRHELEGKQVGLQRFENELKILVGITEDKNAPPAITRIHDSGFVDAELSKSLQKLRHKDEMLNPTPNLEIVSTGMDIQKFLDMKSVLMDKEPDHWLPYLVVELAPYDDSLSRQIKVQPAGKVNLSRLPVNTVVDMALRLLDVMDYMHRKLRYAYIDWKPEHIYWNEASRQLKLIDWNVNARLNGDPGERQIVREDIRMFSGAALYCSLALTDPEELKKPIGPAPTVPRDKVPPIPPRYWTDKPNFYQRDEILDEEIKGLVQKALDPNQGFNSPQEFKNALYQYIEQSKSDLITGLPFDAMQYFRRARSYIAASDFSYAKYWLELAVETARKAGVSYSDAEQLLKSVLDRLAVDEFKQKVKPVLEKEQWKDALDLYAKAVELDSTNTLLKKEFDSLQGLLRAESKLHGKGILKIFMPPGQLQAVLDAARDIVDSDNPLLTYVKKQLNQIRAMQGVITLLGILCFALLAVYKFLGPTMLSVTPTSTFVETSSPLPFTNTPILTEIPSPTFIPPTETMALTPTLVATPISSPIVVFDSNLKILNCWVNEAISPSILKPIPQDGFYRRNDGNWDFNVAKDHLSEKDIIQVDFTQCLGGRSIQALAMNIDVNRLEPESVAFEQVKEREFGFFLVGDNGHRREYTLWIDKNKNLNLRVREDNNIIYNENIDRIVSSDLLNTIPGFPVSYQFSIQMFFQIDNQGQDILYLRKGQLRKSAQWEDINPTQMARIDAAQLKTLDAVQKIGLVGHGGKTETLIWPLIFSEGVTAPLAPTITPTITVLGYGKLVRYIYPLEAPNGNYMGILLGPGQPVTVIAKQNYQGEIWYKCSWRNIKNGVVTEGWFLEKEIQFDPTPTPTP